MPESVAPSVSEAIERAGSAVELLRNAQARPTIFPVTPEFTNWRSEQLSWRIRSPCSISPIT